MRFPLTSTRAFSTASRTFLMFCLVCTGCATNKRSAAPVYAPSNGPAPAPAATQGLRPEKMHDYAPDDFQQPFPVDAEDNVTGGRSKSVPENVWRPTAPVENDGSEMETERIQQTRRPLPVKSASAKTKAKKRFSFRGSEPLSLAGKNTKPSRKNIFRSATFQQDLDPPVSAGQAEEDDEPMEDIVVDSQADLIPDAAVANQNSDPNNFPLDLPTALAMVGGQHPAVGFARWRVQEAYANYDQAKQLWLPNLRAGASWHRHDGNLQTSAGQIVDTNRSAFQYGLGAGGAGGGTTRQPGVVAQFHTRDALLQPKITKHTAWARDHAANAVVNEQLRVAAQAYVELLRAHQLLRVMEESTERTSQLASLTRQFSDAGQGSEADAERLATELHLVKTRLIDAREGTSVAAARLAQAISDDSHLQIVPMDPAIVPLELMQAGLDLNSLIGQGLTQRPELREAQTLVAVACAEHKRQKLSPFVPSLLLAASTSAFGGGTGNSLGNSDNRYDLDAAMTWEVRNLGLGEGTARRAANARIEQAKFRRIRLLDRVAREIREAHAQVENRQERMHVAKAAIETANSSYERNRERIRQGLGLPIEVLQSIRAMENAQRGYLDAVSDYNSAQFQLQWSLGWPVSNAP